MYFYCVKKVMAMVLEMVIDDLTMKKLWDGLLRLNKTVISEMDCSLCSTPWAVPWPLLTTQAI